MKTYHDVGVDTKLAASALTKLVRHFGALKSAYLPIGYFANVIDIGNNQGIAITTDGIGSKAVIAKQLDRYDSVGVDCVAINVNDLICVGAKPLSMVDYIAVEHINDDMFDEIGWGLSMGAFHADISIAGGEIAQLPEIVNGFDLAGTAIGIVNLDRIITGKNVAAGDKIIAIGSSGVHCNGLTLARDVLPWKYTAELLAPTMIYSAEILSVLERVPTVKALIHISGDGLLNLKRIANKRVGFVLSDLPEIPLIFHEIQQRGKINIDEMFRVFNMGIGFCIIAAEEDVDTIMVTLNEYLRQAVIIGEIIDDVTNTIFIPQYDLKL